MKNKYLSTINGSKDLKRRRRLLVEVWPLAFQFFIKRTTINQPKMKTIGDNYYNTRTATNLQIKLPYLLTPG